MISTIFSNFVNFFYSSSPPSQIVDERPLKQLSKKLSSRKKLFVKSYNCAICTHYTNKTRIYHSIGKCEACGTTFNRKHKIYIHLASSCEDNLNLIKHPELLYPHERSQCKGCRIKNLDVRRKENLQNCDYGCHCYCKYNEWCVCDFDCQYNSDFDCINDSD